MGIFYFFVGFYLDWRWYWYVHDVYVQLSVQVSVTVTIAIVFIFIRKDEINNDRTAWGSEAAVAVQQGKNVTSSSATNFVLFVLLVLFLCNDPDYACIVYSDDQHCRNFCKR